MEQKLSNYPVIEDAFNLRDAMLRMLETVNTVFDAHGVPLPARQYITMEQPAEDCEQVTVWFLQMYLGFPGDQASAAQRCTGPRSAVFNIDITREYPIGTNGKPPSTDRMTEAASWSAVDVQVLIDSLEAFNYWNDQGAMGSGVIATVAPTRPQGGLQTVRLNITVQMS